MSCPQPCIACDHAASAPPMAWLSKEDQYYWANGELIRSYQQLGAHPVAGGTWFAVWAPHAEMVSVIGEFNNWDPEQSPMQRVGGGLWEVFVPGAAAEQRYKYRIRRGAYSADKTDPYAFRLEAPKESTTGGLSSIIDSLSYRWSDEHWMRSRQGPGTLSGPLSVYEVHLGSWRHQAHGHSLSYRDIAASLADYVTDLGFTHVELLPLAEHPYYGSWGYQVVGYYAPTFRYGLPVDLMYLIDTLHQRGIGVILDWVPAHFATDPQGLVFFDGSTLYEYDDEMMRVHPDWGTYIFDYAKPEVRNFLISNALFWLDKYHIDALRVDAVASMLYRDYSRDDWRPNIFGGNRNLEAIELLKKTNEAVYTHFPGAFTIAEESTAYPGVSAPTYDDGLGFLYKWNMGWMHDSLAFIQQDPVHRKYHQNQLTFSFMYAFSEHYFLPFSHDEVVHGKGSLWSKMVGDDWQKAANLRLLFGHQFGHPGKKLLFMGGEFGQAAEWNHDGPLDWDAARDPLRAGLVRWITDLNNLYRRSSALWNDTPSGWAWLGEHVDDSLLAYQRTSDEQTLLVIINCTPVPREGWRVGVPTSGSYAVSLNSDAACYGGSGMMLPPAWTSDNVPASGHEQSIAVTLPPLAALFLEYTH